METEFYIKQFTDKCTCGHVLTSHKRDEPVSSNLIYHGKCMNKCTCDEFRDRND